ncbi:hypothetical protein Tco_0690255 [Tanacetum coccineum]
MATNKETYDQPQALTTTNMFQANHEDAYDSDMDEGPNAAAAFMANLSYTSATNSQVNEVHSNDNQIFDNVDYQIQEMHQEEHLDSDAETEIDDNTIPSPSVDEEMRRKKPGHVRPQTVSMIKALMPLCSFLEKETNWRLWVYWLLQYEIASQASNSARLLTPLVHKKSTPVKFCFIFNRLMCFSFNLKIFDDLEAEYEQCVLDNKNLTIEKKNLLIRNDCLIAECLEKDICSIVLTSDIVVPPSSNCLCEDLRSACDREQ